MNSTVRAQFRARQRSGGVFASLSARSCIRHLIETDTWHFLSRDTSN